MYEFISTIKEAINKINQENLAFVRLIQPKIIFSLQSEGYWNQAVFGSRNLCKLNNRNIYLVVYIQQAKFYLHYSQDHCPKTENMSLIVMFGILEGNRRNVTCKSYPKEVILFMKKANIHTYMHTHKHIINNHMLGIE